jgi:hypothetical protein
MAEAITACTAQDRVAYVPGFHPNRHVDELDVRTDAHVGIERLRGFQIPWKR